MCFGANFSSPKYFHQNIEFYPIFSTSVPFDRRKASRLVNIWFSLPRNNNIFPKIDPKCISRITRERGCGSALGVPWIRIRTWCCFNRKVNTQKCAWNQVKSVGKSCSGIVEASNFLFVGKIIMTDHVHITLGWVPKKSGDPIPSRRDAKCKCNRYPGCTRHRAQSTRGQLTAKLIWKRVWSQAVRQVGVGSRVTPSYQSRTLTLPPPQTWSGCQGGPATRGESPPQHKSPQTEMQKHKSSCCTSAPQTNCKAITMNSKRSLFWMFVV